MRKLYLRALRPVAVYGGLLLAMYALVAIGTEKGVFVLQIFSLPWSELLEVDRYATGLSAFEIFLSDHYLAIIVGGLLINGVIVYLLSIAFMLIHRRSEIPTSTQV